MTEITDAEHYACIDGRCKLCNADGSDPEKRTNQVGATALLYGVARNSGALVMDTIDPSLSLDEQVSIVETFYEELTGIKQSAHLGGCGGAGGEVEDNKLIAGNPAIINATEGIMQHPEVLKFTRIPFSPEAADVVTKNAAETAIFEEANNWDGDKYVQGVVASEPRGVEKLKVDETKYHGHAEDAIVIILGNKTLDMQDVFPVTLGASVIMAKALAGQSGLVGQQRVLIANIAKHLATSHRLASLKTPIYLLGTF